VSGVGWGGGCAGGDGGDGGCTHPKIEMLFQIVIYCRSKYRMANYIKNEEFCSETEMKKQGMSAALKARVEKREKKAAAVLARAAGKAAAQERRAADQAVWDEAVRKGREEIEKKIANARKAMGVRKNESNPASIHQMISQWESEMSLSLYAARMGIMIK